MKSSKNDTTNIALKIYFNNYLFTLNVLCFLLNFIKINKQIQKSKHIKNYINPLQTLKNEQPEISFKNFTALGLKKYQQ